MKAPTAVAPTRLGRYWLLGKLASGGMADVYAAQLDGPAGFRKHVVIKRPRAHLADEPRYVRMFLEEARVAARLSHTNICQLYELSEVEGSYFIALEFLHGAPLSRLLRHMREADAAMSIDVAASLIVQACDGLDHAHELRDASGAPIGVVHRDVSPPNLFLTTDGVLKVLDFGIAKADDSLEQTSAGTIKGKHQYMAPEQLRGEPLDRRADVWALGVVLYELLAGRRPFDGRTPYQIARAIMEEPLPHISEIRPDVPAALDDVVARAMCRDRAWRYPTAAAFRVGLLDALPGRARVERTELAALVRDYCGAEIEAQNRLFADADALLTDDPAPPPVRAPAAVLDIRDRLPLRSEETVTTARPAPPPAIDPATSSSELSELIDELAADQDDSGEVEVAAPAAKRGSVGRAVALLVILAGAAVLLYIVRASRDDGAADPERQVVVASGAPESAPAVDPEPRPETAAEPEAVAEPAAVEPAAVAEPIAAEPEAEAEAEADGEPEPEPEAEPAREAEPKPRAPRRAARKRAPSSKRAAAEPGKVFIDSSPYATIYDGARELGVTPLLGIELPAGKHRLRAVNAAGDSRRFTIEVKPGKTVRRRLTW